MIREIADCAHPCDSYIDGNGPGKLQYVDYDALRSMYIRGLREQLAVALQRANSVIVRYWLAFGANPRPAHAGPYPKRGRPTNCKASASR